MQVAEFKCAHAQFGAPIPWRSKLRMPVALVDPPSACGPFRPGKSVRVVAGHGANLRAFLRRKWWALVTRGECSFTDKALNLQQAGSVHTLAARNTRMRGGRGRGRLPTQLPSIALLVHEVERGRGVLGG